MPMMDLAQVTSPVEYVLYAFMAMNMLLSGMCLLLQGVRKLRPARYLIGEAQ